MAPPRYQSLLIAVVIMGLLLTTSAGRVSSAPVQVLGTGNALSSIVSAQDEETRDEEEDSGGGWFDTVVDTTGDVLGGAKDVIVDTAGSVWGAAQAAPGAVWDFIKGVPGALGGLIVSAWDWLKDGSIELEDWRVFLESHWLLGAILGPLVEFLIGLTPDGTISYLEIGLGLILLALPAVKGVQSLWKGADNLLPWANDVNDAVGAVRRNPGGVVDGIYDSYRFARAKTIAPSADDFAKLPNSPGVYVAVDGSGKPLYIGMSKSLERRVPEHFDNTPSGFSVTTEKIKIMPTKSVRDAWVLECDLIKTHMPAHNTIYKNRNTCPSFNPPAPSWVP